MSTRCEYFRCGYAEDLLKKFSLRESNVISMMTNIFINCYGEYLERRDRCVDDYISLYSRYATEILHREFRCDQIRDLLSRASDYIKRIIDASKSVGLDVIVLRLETISRLTINTRGSAMPLEIGLSWDPYMNLPYIPSTSIKGVARDYFEENSIRIGDYNPSDLFGDTTSTGLLVFYDAYPVNCSTNLIEPEVLTPHYSETRGRISEVEAQPTPLVYPVVARGVVFQLPIVIMRRGDKESRGRLSGELIDVLISSLVKALERGIGAKTSVGYGFMRVSRA